MKVLVIGYLYYNPFSQRGINVLCETFSELGANVDFYSYPCYLYNPLKLIKFRKTIKNINSKIANTRIKNKIAYSLLPYSAKRFKKISKKFLKIFEFFHINTIPKIDMNKYDVIVLESGKPVFFANELPVNKKIIYRMSDPVSYDLAPGLAEYEFKLIEKADVTLVPNKLIYEKYSNKLSYLKNKIVVWKNGFRNLKNTNAKNPFKKNTKNISYMGLAPIDWNLIIYAALKLPEINFHIIGPHKYNGNLPENIYLYGLIPNNDAWNLIKFSDVLIIPYKNLDRFKLHDGLTSKVLLFMSTGKPIVASNFYNSHILKKYGVKVADNFDNFVKLIKNFVDAPKKVSYNINLEKFEISERKKELIKILNEYNILKSSIV